jgi:4-coumarate--CoA ligase
MGETHEPSAPVLNMVLLSRVTEEQRSFAEVVHDVDSVAAQLRLGGFKQGDTLALFTPNTVDYFTIIVAVAKLGGSVTPINPVYTAHEVGRQIELSGSSFVVSHPDCLAVAMEASKQSPVPVHQIVLGHSALEGATPFEGLRTAGGAVEQAPVSGDATVLLPYSSGTTGLPKGVMLVSHRTLLLSQCFEGGSQASFPRCCKTPLLLQSKTHTPLPLPAQPSHSSRFR